MRGRSAFTLFEVVISMLVLSIAVLTTIALLPIGLKAQQLARYQLYAGSAALTLMENFHAPMISFNGHGTLAPDLNTNLAPAGSPPIPGWANRLRDCNLVASPYQHDIERYLCGWMTGVYPVPLEIARRIDSDNDEIQRLLDAGGCLLYQDTGYVRGLTVSSARDKSLTLNPAQEAHKLVFAVTGYAQQNALTSHPVESWPWYEIYPFPPAWVALRASGHEIRRGPVHKMFDPATGTYGGPIRGQNMLGLPASPSGSPPPGLGYGDGIVWGDGGHFAWSPVTFPDAPQNERQIRPLRATPWSPLSDQTRKPIDPADVAPDAAGDWNTGSTGWYQGRDWRYFAATCPPGSLWDRGWLPFQRLAGFNDTLRPLPDWNAYAAAPLASHYEKAGWLPVMALLTSEDSATYNNYWYQILPDPAPSRKSKYLGEQVKGALAVGRDTEVGSGVFPPRPSTLRVKVNGWDPYYPPTPWIGNELCKFTGAPHSTLLPTYEMRASYRDKALDLAYAVFPDIPPVTKSSAFPPGVRPNVTNTQIDCDSYEYGPLELMAFPLIDPHASSRLPPHPAQVLALSYLAHAAMLMTGWDPPFIAPDVLALLDWESLTWQYQAADPLRPGVTITGLKDAKLLVDDPANAMAGATSITITNDSAAPIHFYKGDEICLEEDYREWFARNERNPDRGEGVQKYRVTDDLYIAGNPVPGATTGNLKIQPPLARTYTKMMGTHGADPNAFPPILADPVGHNQQLIRICSDYDRAFARTVHETCMRFAAAYGCENPYDWGAPRMANHQVMVDKPLALLDLFMDAGRGPSSDGHAQRVPQGLPTSTLLSSGESFYRWIMPPNPATRDGFRTGTVPASPAAPVCALSHLGPGRWNETSWTSVMYNPQLAPPGSAGGSWNWSSDADRYWLNRPFQAFHRDRQLAFWAVDWKQYEDAETAPSAPLDLAKHARSIRTKPDGVTVDSFWPMLQPGDSKDAYDRADSQFAGNPENALVWLDATRQQRFIDTMTNLDATQVWAYTRENEDIVLGHWGADRNNNRVLDIGPIPKTTRLRAAAVARFNVYDPVLRLNNGD